MSKKISRFSLLAISLLLSACLGDKQKIVPETPQTKALKTYNEAAQLHQEKKYDEAKTKLDAALALDPNLAKAYHLLGLGALAEGRPEEAKTHFLKARELDPKSSESAIGLGNTYTQLGDNNAAETALAEAVTLDPNSSRAHYYLAEVYVKQGKLDLAEQSYRESIRLKPDDSWPKLGLSRLVRRSNPEEAKQLAEEALTINGESDEPYHQLGVLASDASKYDIAEKYFTSAIEKNDKLPRNFMNLGTVQSYQGKLDAAKISFEKAIQLDPAYALAYNNLGHVQRQAKRNEEAIAAAQKAVELDNKIPLYHVNLGDTYSAVGKYSEAAKSYEAALLLAPGQAQLARKWALSLSQAGDSANAYRVLADFISKNPAQDATPALKEELARIAKEELKSQLR